MKIIPLIAAVMLGAAAAPAATKEPEYATPPPQPILSTDLSGGDLVFLTGAASRIALVVRLSDLARTHAETPEVQAVAAAVWKDQTDAAARLKDLAGRKHVPLDDEPDGLGKRQLETLANLKGPRFDKSYLDALGDAQDALESSLQTGAESSDKEIKAFAEAGRATLKQERAQVSKLGM